MTTDRACLSLRYETCSVVISHNNGQSMVIYSSGMKHVPSVATDSSQWSEHGHVFLGYETCSVSCHRLIVVTTLSVDFSDAQGHLTSKSVMESCQI